jgi:hypothetical protein
MKVSPIQSTTATFKNFFKQKEEKKKQEKKEKKVDKSTIKKDSNFIGWA